MPKDGTMDADNQIELHSFAEAVNRIARGGTVSRFGSQERYYRRADQLWRDSPNWQRQTKMDYSTGFTITTFDLAEQAASDWVFIE